MAKITQITYDLQTFSYQAIKRAIHDANFSQFTIVSASDEKTITIKIYSENVNESNQEIERKLNKLVFDNQIRIDTEKEFRDIRKLIIAQAFFPCENLEKILKDFDL